MDAERDADPAEDCHYGSYYYEHCCGQPYDRSEEWLGLFRRFADRIVADPAPASVLDAGCAMGLLVEALVDRGVDAHGIDISSYAISKVRPDIADRCRVGSILEPFGRRYDLIVSIEVVEHLQPPDAERAIANLCEHADDVILSTTPFDYKEASHFNVQPPEYWAELFARNGFVRDVDYDASFITRWAMRFRKEKVALPRLVQGYERKLWRVMQENLGARESLLEHQDALIKAAQENAELGALRVEAADLRARVVDLTTQLHEAIGRGIEQVREREAQVARAVDTMRRAEDLRQRMDGVIAEKCRELLQAASYIDTITQSEAAVRRERDEARLSAVSAHTALEATRAELDGLRASRAFRLANRMARMKGLIAPEGSRRKRAIRAALDWRSRRRDAGHAHGPKAGRSSESIWQ